MCLILRISIIFILIVNIASSDRTYGNCQESRIERLLWQYELRRPPFRMIHQTAEASYGPVRAMIKCIKVISMDSDNSVPTIISGGVGSNHVDFSFTSSPGRPIRIRILAYGDVLDRRNRII